MLRRRLLLAFLTGISFLLAGMLSDCASRQASGLEALWPCNAIVLGILIARARSLRDSSAITVGGFAGGIAFHLLRHDGPTLTILFSVANIVEAVGAFTLLRRFGRVGDIFDRVNDVFAFMGACMVASLGAATIGSAALALATPAHFVDAWTNWYVEGVLSQLVLAPMIVIGAQLADRRRARAIAARTVAEVMLLLGLCAAITAGVFLWTRLPLLFLITPIVLVTTFRLRAFGAVGAVAIVAVVAAYATAEGHGPIMAHVHSPADQMLLLQLFLSCTFLTALPVAAMLTERDFRAEEARMMAERFKAVVENIGEVIYRIDREGDWAYLNPAWETLTGRRIADAIGRPWTEYVDAADRDDLAARMRAILAGDAGAMRRAIRFETTTGLRWMEVFVQKLHDGDGVVCGVTGTMRDIDERKKLEEHVMTAKRRAEQRAREATLLASTDELTGIANRRAFMQQLEREMAGAAEFGWPLAVAIFDVDHFKNINDRHGHAVGDRVLQLIAQRAGAAIRGGDLVGRLGGEEFGILMPGASSEEAAIVAERLREAMENRRDAGGLPPATVSIGIAEREGLRDPLALLSAADAALYAAKEAGRNRIRIAA